MRPPLYVTTDAFDTQFDRLVANFDSGLDDSKAEALKREYRRVFSDDREALKPAYQRVFRADPGAPRDDLLEQAVNRLIDYRTERGMPRVAELRREAEAVADDDAAFRQGRAIIERERAAEQTIQGRRDGR